MFEKLEIRGFSTNKKLDVEFGPGVTSIVGRSFKGKSASIQALRWVCLNVPTGEEFINWDFDKVAVRLSLDDKRIIRSRGKGGNIYKRSQHAGSQRLKGYKVYAAFGNNVPAAIEKILNVSKLNFQGQHDRPFWFGETAGEVSRQLNAIVNLEVIDNTLREIAIKKNKAVERIELTEERLSDAVKEKKELAYIVRMDRGLTELEGMEAQIQLKERICTQIDELIKSGQIHASTRENASVGLSLAQMALSTCDTYRDIAKSVDILGQLIKETRRLRQITKVTLPSIKPVRDAMKRVAETDDKIFELKNLIRDAETKKELVCENKKTIKSMESKLTDFDACPLCKREFK